MKIIFVHDHIFKVTGADCYSSGGLPAAVWQRYLFVFNGLTVVGRDGGCLSPEDRGYTLSSTEGVKFKLLPNISNLKNLLWCSEIVSKECKRLISEHDGVIARLPSRLGHVFVAEAIRQGKPYAVEVVACPWDALWNYGNWKGKLLAPFSMLNLKRSLYRSPFALYVTKEFLQKRYPTKGVSTFCSNVEISEVAQQVLSHRIRSIQNGNKIVFGLIGNYSSRYKGIDVAIQALAAIDDRLPEWEFQIIGSGDSAFYLQLANSLGVSNKVKFVGSKASGQPVYDWLDTVDIYLQPSYQEGLPRALIEAMSRGCPALATSVAGIPELLHKTEMVKPGDFRSLSEQILSMSSDLSRRSQAANANFEKAKEYYKYTLDERRSSFWKRFHASVLR